MMTCCISVVSVKFTLSNYLQIRLITKLISVTTTRHFFLATRGKVGKIYLFWNRSLRSLCKHSCIERSLQLQMTNFFFGRKTNINASRKPLMTNRKSCSSNQFYNDFVEVGWWKVVSWLYDSFIFFSFHSAMAFRFAILAQNRKPKTDPNLWNNGFCGRCFDGRLQPNESKRNFTLKGNASSYLLLRLTEKSREIGQYTCSLST